MKGASWIFIKLLLNCLYPSPRITNDRGSFHGRVCAPLASGDRVKLKHIDWAAMHLLSTSRPYHLFDHFLENLPSAHLLGVAREYCNRCGEISDSGLWLGHLHLCMFTREACAPRALITPLPAAGFTANWWSFRELPSR